MRKFAIISIVFGILLTLSACMAKSNPGASSPADAADTQSAGSAAMDGEVHETDKFSITVPTGWEIMDVEGGLQLYKMSGEVVDVHFRGENQNEDHAKQQVASTAEMYEGTAPAEVELLGKKFWTTIFTASGIEQACYLRMEDGVMLSIKCTGAGYDTDPEIEAIINSIVFY